MYHISSEHGGRLDIRSVALQAVSSRPDVIPPGFLAELEKLQDQIPPFPDEDAYAVISAELGVPASAVFSSLTPSPIAAASLGQARFPKAGHLAAYRLPDHASMPSCGMWRAQAHTYISCVTPLASAYISSRISVCTHDGIGPDSKLQGQSIICFRGQVYKGTLRSNGQAVAVKVQRPGVREQIAMDVFILRNLLAFVREWRKVNRHV